MNSANAIAGSLYSKMSNLHEYLNLKSENKILITENVQLKNLLEKKKSLFLIDSVRIDSNKYQQKYTYINAKIIKNDYTKAFNFITINKGKKQGLDQEMAVINSKGIIGMTDNSSNNYTRVQSILNENSKINARLKHSFYFGTLTWDGRDYNTVQLLDLPRQAVLKIGDTIETGGKSTIFPEGIPIGTISKIGQKNTPNNRIDLKLFNDMSNLGFVYVIKNLHKKEIKSLEITENE